MHDIIGSAMKMGMWFFSPSLQNTESMPPGIIFTNFNLVLTVTLTRTLNLTLSALVVLGRQKDLSMWWGGDCVCVKLP